MIVTRPASAPQLVLALLLAPLLAAACGGGGEGETWRFALEEIEGSVQHAYATRFEELVEERSGGEVDVVVYPYGALGSSAQLTEQVRSDAIQIAFASAGHLGSVIPEVQVFSLHFVFSDDPAVNHRVLTTEGPLRELLAEAYRDRGLHLLAIVPEGWMVWTADRPLRTPADFEGLKIRTMESPLLVESYRAYGASPTPMPYSEVYSALQLGMIDAQVNPVFAIEEMSFYEVQDVMTFANHLPFVATVVAAPAWVDGLTPDRRALLREVAIELDTYIAEVEGELNESRLETIREQGGTEIVRLGDAERAAFRERSLPVRETYAELAGARGERVLELLLDEVGKAEAAQPDGEDDGNAEGS
ncbi:MAG: TRAP transporter substrate-binding protein DctP [Myxococcota bacterium]|nr:TRAP transporter substrate-binding protein DctP [Myxococcota bacterium]